MDLGLHPVQVGELVPHLHLLVVGLLLILLEFAFGTATLADRLHNIGGYALRQAHLGRGGEGLIYGLIHLDHHILLGLHELVALGHLILHPRLEVILHHRVDDVANPGLRRLMQFLLVGQELVDFRVVAAELPDLLELQLLILRDLDEAHLVALDVYSKRLIEELIIKGPTSFFGGHEVLEEVNGYILIRRQITAHINCQEV